MRTITVTIPDNVPQEGVHEGAPLSLVVAYLAAMLDEYGDGATYSTTDAATDLRDVYDVSSWYALDQHVTTCEEEGQHIGGTHSADKCEYMNALNAMRS